MYMYGSELYILFYFLCVTDLCIYVQVGIKNFVTTIWISWVEWVPNMPEHDKMLSKSSCEYSWLVKVRLEWLTAVEEKKKFECTAEGSTMLNIFAETKKL